MFAILAKFVARALIEVGEKKEIAGAILIPSGFAETGNVAGQNELAEIGRKYGVRLMGPNIYGFYYTPSNLCATFCTAYDVKGKAALSSQSGGIGMAIIGFSRSAKMGVSAIVGLGNKSDIDEDDLLTFFEQDENTSIIAQHCEDLKDGRSFAEVAKRVSKKKPIVVLKAGRTNMGARAASSHTGALAGNDKIYEDVFKQSGVIRARSLRDSARVRARHPCSADTEGQQRGHHHGCVVVPACCSDACVDNGLSLMAMPADLDAAFRKFIPPFGAAGNPVRHYRRRAAQHLSRTPCALGLEDSAHSRADPGLLAHHHHAAHGVREIDGRSGGRDAYEGHREAGRGFAGRRRGSGGSGPNICTSMAFPPTRIPRRSRSPFWARSTNTYVRLTHF